MARAGRRRRVLNEEVRTAGSTPVLHSSSEWPAGPPRYGEQANIENHPQITDFVPRRNRVVMLTLLVGVAIAAAAGTLVRYAGEVSQWLPPLSTSDILVGLADRLVAWSSAVVLLAIAAIARVTFMLRRHRVDDYRGRYRVWRLATWMAVALSLNAVVGLHQMVSQVLGELTGWQLLANHAGWWLAASFVVGGWLLFRLLLDMTECRIAMFTALLAVGCYIAAGIARAVTWSPDWLGAWSGLSIHFLPYFGHLLMLSALMFNARYVVLDVQGLIQPRKQKPRAKVAKLQAVDLDRSSTENSADEKAQSSKPAASTGDWIDGADPDAEGEHGKKRRLSKSERKRLRKQKARHAA